MKSDPISGLSKLLQGEIPSNSIILVTGGPGTLKSGFVGTYISNAIRQSDDVGIYITIEESKDSLLRNWKALKIDVPENLKIIDFRDLRKEMTPSEDTHVLSFLEEVIDSEKLLFEKSLRYFALDSLGALYSLIGHETVRTTLFSVFQKLKEANLTSFFIYEEQRGLDYDTRLTDECFLADGLINLGITQKGSRYLRIEKMRAVRHSMQPHHLDVSASGVSILGPRLE